MVVDFPLKRIAKALFALVIVLSILHTASLLLHDAYNNQITELLVEKFSFDLERNFPTYFSSLILFSSSVLFFLIGSARKNNPGENNHKYWLGLGLVFLFLSADEAAHIHEHLDTDLIWGAYEAVGLLAWPWVLIYGGLVGFFVLAYFKFWLRLPSPFKWSYFATGAVYVGSALGFEMLEAFEYSTNQDTRTSTYYVLVSLEEFFEMSAIVFLVFINMKYLVTVFPQTSFSFSNEQNV